MLKLLFGILFILSAAGCLKDGGTSGSSSNSLGDGSDVSQSSVASNNYDWSSTTLEVPAIGSAAAPASVTGVTTYHSPEPATILLLSIGFGGILAARRIKRKKA